MMTITMIGGDFLVERSQRVWSCRSELALSSQFHRKVKTAAIWLQPIDKVPRLSIRKVILILPSDTLFDDDCICFDHSNGETAMPSSSHLLLSIASLKYQKLHLNIRNWTADDDCTFLQI